MKKMLVVLVVVCIPCLAVVSGTSYRLGVKRRSALNILEQGKIIREQFDEGFGNNEDNFGGWYVVIYQSVPYKCSVLELYVRISATCFHMRIFD